MKSIITLAAACLLTLGLVSCDSEGSIDTTKVSDAFKEAPAEVKSKIDAVVEKISSGTDLGQFKDALASLQGMDMSKFTADQKGAVEELIGSVKTKITDMGAALAKDGEKKIEDAKDKVEEGAEDLKDDAKDAIDGLTGDK